MEIPTVIGTFIHKMVNSKHVKIDSDVLGRFCKNSKNCLLALSVKQKYHGMVQCSTHINSKSSSNIALISFPTNLMKFAHIINKMWQLDKAANKP